LPLHCIRDEPE